MAMPASLGIVRKILGKVTVIVVELDDPAVTVTLLGFAESVT